MIKKLIAATTIALTATAATAGTAFFSYETSTGGMTKICVYNYLGDSVAITISSTSLCPLTINA